MSAQTIQFRQYKQFTTYNVFYLHKAAQFDVFLSYLIKFPTQVYGKKMLYILVKNRKYLLLVDLLDIEGRLKLFC